MVGLGLVSGSFFQPQGVAYELRRNRGIPFVDKGSSEFIGQEHGDLVLETLLLLVGIGHEVPVGADPEIFVVHGLDIGPGMGRYHAQSHGYGKESHGQRETARREHAEKCLLEVSFRYHGTFGRHM